MTSPPENTEYVLGYSDDEHARLDVQALLLEPATRWALEKVSVKAGWRCLDVACGTGSVTRILGDLVGPNGSVHAVDLDETYGNRAIKKLESAGSGKFSFEKLDVTAGVSPKGAPFDLVFTRLLILHMAEPLKVLKNLWSWVKPGGVLLVQDYDMLPATTFTDGGNAEHGSLLIRKIFGAMGVDFRAGSTMPRKFLMADIGPHDGIEVSATFVPGKDNIARSSPVLHSLKPVALKYGLVAEGEIEVLLAAMAIEGQEPHCIGRWPDLISTWKFKPRD